MSEEQKKKRRRRPPRNRNKNNNQKPKQNNALSNNSNAQAKKTSGKSNRSNNRNKRKKPLKADQIVLKYDNLMGQYLGVRKKYFDQFYKLGQKKKKSLMNNYIRTLSELKAFANKLKPWQKEILENQRTEFFPKDLQYSQSKGLPETGEVEEGSKNFNQIHTTEVQAARVSYKNDNEATSGTQEDYDEYKAQREFLV